MNQEEVQTKKTKVYKIDFTLEEIRDLVLQYIDKAQNMSDPWCLTTLKIYNYYHKFIEEYFKIHKNKKPTKADKLAYIILLSYSKRRIQNAISLNEFKLFQHEYSDFKIIDVIDSKYNENDENHNDRHDCICSYPNLEIIYIVENELTGIRLQIGSECITKYKIISLEELKRYEEKRKADRERILERKREQSEGVPVGHYENLRRHEREAKIISGDYRGCLKCSEPINIKHKKDIYLCKKCIKYNKNISCENCNIPVVLDINSINEYCLPCEERKSNCLVCSVEFIRKDNEERCFLHQTIYDNREILGKCENCNEKFPRKNKDSWRTFCRECYIKFPNCVHCSEKMIVRTSNTERNPGRKYFTCKNLSCSKKNKWSTWLKEYFEELKDEILHDEG